MPLPATKADTFVVGILPKQKRQANQLLRKSCDENVIQIGNQIF